MKIPEIKSESSKVPKAVIALGIAGVIGLIAVICAVATRRRGTADRLADVDEVEDDFIDINFEDEED